MYWYRECRYFRWHSKCKVHGPLLKTLVRICLKFNNSIFQGLKKKTTPHHTPSTQTHSHKGCGKRVKVQANCIERWVIKMDVWHWDFHFLQSHPEQPEQFHFKTASHPNPAPQKWLLLETFHSHRPRESVVVMMVSSQSQYNVYTSQC